MFGVLVAELVSFACAFGLQRLFLRTRGWFAVVCAGIVGNSVTDVLPAGDAFGAGVQFEMLPRGSRRSVRMHTDRLSAAARKIKTKKRKGQ
jgi:hypothetical protein